MRCEIPVIMQLSDGFLAVRIAPVATKHRTHVVLLNDEDFAAFLLQNFPELNLPSALRRLLFLHLAGISLKEEAAVDDRSVETRKRQSQQLRTAFAIDDLASLGRTVASALAVALDRHINPQGTQVGRSIAQYVERYLPLDTRLYALSGRSEGTFTILEMGPVDGKPILVLHAMALPDIRAEDAGLLHRLGVRLIWPLRHGICAPDASPLPHVQHITHAIKGARSAIDIACGGAAPVLAFAAASKIGIELAKSHPETVDALHVAGVCVREGRPEGGVRRLARGVLNLAERAPVFLDPVLAHLETQLREPGTLKWFMEKQFAASSADLAIVQAELSGPFGERRLRDALLDSAASARHDFLFQQDLGWDRAPAELEIHLHHGSDDCIHPMGLIEDLNNRLPNSTLHRYSETGQLFC